MSGNSAILPCATNLATVIFMSYNVCISKTTKVVYPGEPHFTNCSPHQDTIALNVYACVCMCVHALAYVCACTCKCVCVLVYVYACTCMCFWNCVCVLLHCVCASGYVYVCVQPNIEIVVPAHNDPGCGLYQGACYFMLLYMYIYTLAQLWQLLSQSTAQFDLHMPLFHYPYLNSGFM